MKDGTLKKEQKQIKEMTPKPMHTMLTKQTRESAIKKRNERKAMVVKDVPPTSGLIITPLTLSYHFTFCK